MQTPGSENPAMSTTAGDAAYSPDWMKSQTPSYNPDYNQSGASTASTAATVDCSFYGNSTVTAYPEHSEFYAQQPAQASEADEIAKQKKEQEDANKKRGMGGAVGGAAAVAGVAGLVLVGPLVGVVAAGGAAYVAATNKGAAGSVVRASGTAATAVGSSARNFDKKHRVVARTGKGIATSVGWVAGKWKNRQQRRQSHQNNDAAVANLTS